MFSFFKKREVVPPVSVYADKVQMYRQLMTDLAESRQSVVVCFFEKTADELTELINAAQIRDIRLVVAPVSADDLKAVEQVFIAEIYPTGSFYTQTVKTISSAGKSVFKVVSHLDNPFFSHFGGDRLKALTVQLGMKSDEALTHPMIDRAISNAQSKTESGLAIERKAASMEEWFSINQPRSR